MRRCIVITDSGFGGLSVAARLEASLERSSGSLRLIYVNACPSDALGYNQMQTRARKRETFANVLRAIEARWAPAQTVVACNTLSTLLGEIEQHASATRGLTEAGAASVCAHLRARPGSVVLALATATTVAAMPWTPALRAAGLASERLRYRACPGLETRISNDASGRDLACALAEIVEQVAPRVDAVLLGCSHYCLRSAEFGRAFGPGRTILDPAATLAAELGARAWSTQTDAELSVEFISRYRPPRRELETIAALIAPQAPRCAAAVLGATIEPDLFAIAPPRTKTAPTQRNRPQR